ALLNSDAAIVVTEWDNIASLRPDAFKKNMKTPVVVDGRRVYKPSIFENQITLLSMGRRD
ncbi:MAG: UDP binding domain-containing protein, partial [Candidatus Thorarchaeota archaeon]